MILRTCVVSLALLAIPFTASAQDTSSGGQQRLLGLRLFNQSCRVCHTKPQLSSPQYAPPLSMNTLNGKANVIRDVITNGTPRMPGFKYDLKPAEIDAIVAYIQTIPAPTVTAPAAAKSGPSREAD